MAVARLVLGPGMRIQAPPNLVSREECLALVAAGVDDWGGVSPLTPDHVNPERPWPALEELDAVTAEAGFDLVQRLTAQPKYVQAGAAWIDPRVRGHVVALADPATGLARDVNPTGMPWQEPDDVESTGRVDLNSEIDTQGRNSEARSDLDSAFGDWESIRAHVHELAAAAPERIDTDVLAALRSAERDPAACTDDEYLALATADGPALEAVAALADALRRDAVGDDVTFVVNRNINFTNICYTGCRFCAFAQRKGDADAFSLSARGGRRPCLGGVRRRCDRGVHAGRDRPRVAGHRLRRPGARRQSPGSVDACARVFPDGDRQRRDQERVECSRVADQPARGRAGARIPGTAAEILDDEVRWVLTKGKLPSSMWIDIVTTAHEVGLRSSSTMMYGHVDSPRHWVAHLNVLREIQDRTGGFTEFVPLPFVHQNSPLYLAGAARPGPTHRDNRAVHALARIMLHGRISHIQTSWVKLGVERTQVMLNGGANDLGGTLMEETISRMAGSEYGSSKSVAELSAIAEGIGRPARQRTTTYSSAGRVVVRGRGYTRGREASHRRPIDSPSGSPSSMRCSSVDPIAAPGVKPGRFATSSSTKPETPRNLPGYWARIWKVNPSARAASRNARAPCATSTTRTCGTR